jgi:hypothetical protein
LIFCLLFVWGMGSKHKEIRPFFIKTKLDVCQSALIFQCAWLKLQSTKNEQNNCIFNIYFFTLLFSWEQMNQTIAFVSNSINIELNRVSKRL